MKYKIPEDEKHKKIFINEFYMKDDFFCGLPSMLDERFVPIYNSGIATWSIKLTDGDTILRLNSKCKCNYLDGDYILHMDRDTNFHNVSRIFLSNQKLDIIATKDYLGGDPKLK
jgi:hypothetical protein